MHFDVAKVKHTHPDHAEVCGAHPIRDASLHRGGYTYIYVFLADNEDTANKTSPDLPAKLQCEPLADVAELVDAPDLGSGAFGVRVRVSPSAPASQASIEASSSTQLHPTTGLLRLPA